MRTIIALATLFVVALALPGNAGHGMQSGSNGDCLDYNVLYLSNAVSSPLAVEVVAHPGSYVITSSDGTAFVDFFGANGAWLGYNNGASFGTAPAGTVKGIICVGALGDYPDVPFAGATWTFMQ
jgi:hypothetical protein